MRQRGRRFGRSGARRAASSPLIAKMLQAAPGKGQPAVLRPHGARARRVESHGCSVGGAQARWWTSAARPPPRSCPPAPLDDRNPAAPTRPRRGGRSRMIHRRAGLGGAGRWPLQARSYWKCKPKDPEVCCTGRPFQQLTRTARRPNIPSLTFGCRLCLRCDVCISNAAAPGRSGWREGPR